jgi:hypothetical protein
MGLPVLVRVDTECACVVLAFDAYAWAYAFAFSSMTTQALFLLLVGFQASHWHTFHIT